MADFADRPVEPLHHGEKLQGGDEAVAGGGEVGHDDVAGLLAAEVEAVLEHGLADVAVADRRADHGETDILEEALEAEIGHNRDGDGRLGEAPVRRPRFGDGRKQLIAVDQLALFVDDDDPVGVAVERDADVGADLDDLGGERGRRGGADPGVDVEAVGFDADGEDFGAEFPERRRGNLVSGTVGAIDDDAEPGEGKIAGERPLGEFDVAILDAVDALGAAEGGRRCEAAA